MRAGNLSKQTLEEMTMNIHTHKHKHKHKHIYCIYAATHIPFPDTLINYVVVSKKHSPKKTQLSYKQTALSFFPGLIDKVHQELALSKAYFSS